MFRRRRFGAGRRRFFRRPVQRERPVWSTTNFNETALALDTTRNDFILWLPSVQYASETAAPSDQWQLRRIIVNGDVAVVPETTTLASDIVVMFGALFIDDTFATGSTLITTARGDTLEGGTDRLLWTNCWSWGQVEIPTATRSDTVIRVPVRIEIDIKVRARLSFNKVVMLSLQWGSSVGNVIAAAAFSATTRVLLVNP